MKVFARRGRLVAAAVAVLAAAAAVAAAMTGSGRQQLPVTAMMPDASPIVPGNIVRSSGIEVGRVESVRLEHGQAAVRMRLNPEVLPLHADARVKIRPVTLLGERFIELNRGTPSAPPLPSPPVIQASHTSRSVDLDEILNSVDNPTGTALAALVTTLGEGTGGQGTNVDGAIRALAPAMQNTQQLGQVVNQQNAVLSRLVDRAAPVAEAAAGRDGPQLNSAIAATRRSLHAVATQREALRDAVRQLPGTLVRARRVLSQAAGIAESGTPTLAAARPATDSLPQLARELTAFSDSADPALASLPPVLGKAKALLDAAGPALRDLRPGAQAFPGIGGDARRLSSEVTPAMGTIMDFIRNWAMSTNGRDGLGNYFRAFMATTPQSLMQAPGMGLGPVREPGKDAAAQRPGQPAPTPAPGPAQGGSATGLSPGQENSLVGQLLGGR